MRKSKKYAYGLSKNFMGLKHNSTITLDTIEDLIAMKSFEKSKLFKPSIALYNLKLFKNKKLNMFKNFRNKKVIITGHAGFELMAYTLAY